MARMDSNLYSLPNELLDTILSHLPTTALLPLTTTSHRLHDLILNLVRARLVRAGRMRDRRVLLECCHPSTQAVTGPMLCELVLDEKRGDGDAEAELVEERKRSGDGRKRMRRKGKGGEERKGTDLGPLGRLHEQYTIFRPLPPASETSSSPPRSHPAGGPLPSLAASNHPLASYSSPEEPTPSPSSSPSSSVSTQASTLASSTSPSPSPSSASSSLSELSLSSIPRVLRTVTLESHELFSQLCGAAHLIIEGPRPGLYRDLMTLGKGILRVWREDLDRLLDHRYFGSRAGTEVGLGKDVDGNMAGGGPRIEREERGREVDGERDGDEAMHDDEEENGNGNGYVNEAKVIWFSLQKDVGLRIRPRTRDYISGRRTFDGIIGLAEDDDEGRPVIYQVELEALLIRTTHLLLTVEAAQQSRVEDEYRGRAVVFGSFVNAGTT